MAATATLHRVLAVLLVFRAVVFTAVRLGTIPTADLPGPVRVVTGVVFGLRVGVVGAVLGVAGGERLVPDSVLLFALDVKLAGSLASSVSGDLLVGVVPATVIVPLPTGLLLSWAVKVWRHP